ncbi:MAG: hypothetical protein R3266_00835 [Gemmatimonadota bacterium]|nr:hypothetical protein [Gemmatimonadota bacterium]
MLLAWTGRAERALAEIETAVREDPLNLILSASAGWILYYARRYEEALDALNDTLAMDADFAPALSALGQIRSATEDFGQAVETHRRAYTASGESASSLSLLAYALARAGERAEAEAARERLETLARTRYVSPYYLALRVRAPPAPPSPRCVRWPAARDHGPLSRSSGDPLACSCRLPDLNVVLRLQQKVTHMRARLSALSSFACAGALLLSSLHASSASAQAPVHIEGLGSLSFPNSGELEAQEDFLTGVLLLHSFEYERAAEAFRRAQAIDPDFALAYWGEAMTHNHPVWNEKDAAAAREALSRLAPTAERRLAQAPTDREKGYLAAVDVLYGDGAKARLDTLYAIEMEKLADAHPDDLEAQTFYALALLGLSQGSRDVPTYMEAGAIALDAFEKNPDHPGAAHYAIHAFDDPTHAVLAMEAARAYSGIAPNAAHAQHMTTHIFLARGLWDDVVAQNLRAVEVVNRLRAEAGRPPTSCGHYNEWLMYGYDQQGRYAAAADLLGDCHAQSVDPERSADARESAAFSHIYLRGLHVADTRDGSSEATRAGVRVPEPTVTMRLIEAWGDGVAALYRGERAEAEAAHAILVAEGDEAPRNYVTPYVPVWRGTLAAMLLADAGDTDAAVAAAREAAEYEASLPVDFGPPLALKPARELEGELLLEAGRPDEAMTAFRLQLARTPNRIVTLGGLARAALAAGRPDLAERTYRDLMTLLAEADPDQPELVEATAFLARSTDGVAR